MKLTNEIIINSQPRSKPYRLFDGGGLYIEISTSGTKAWRYKYRFEGKEKRISLGIYPNISIDEARIDLIVQKSLLKQGIDPSEARKDVNHHVEKLSQEDRANNEKTLLDEALNSGSIQSAEQNSHEDLKDEVTMTDSDIDIKQLGREEIFLKKSSKDKNGDQSLKEKRINVDKKSTDSNDIKLGAYRILSVNFLRVVSLLGSMFNKGALYSQNIFLNFFKFAQLLLKPISGKALMTVSNLYKSIKVKKISKKIHLQILIIWGQKVIKISYSLLKIFFNKIIKFYSKFAPKLALAAKSCILKLYSVCRQKPFLFLITFLTSVMLIFGLLYLLSVNPGTQQADLKDNEVLNAKSNELIIARYFTQGKNYLNLSYDEELKDVVRNVNLNKNQVDIVGYADARGSRIYNLNLANMRAFNTLKSLGDIGLDLSLVNNIDIKVPKDSANCQRFNNCNNYMKVEILIQKKSNLNQ